MAAIKVVSYAPSTTRHPVDRRALQKEVQIHSILKHSNVLEFIVALEFKDSKAAGRYVPGLYMVLELGAGGDLFDKIGELVVIVNECCVYLSFFRDWVHAG